MTDRDELLAQRKAEREARIADRNAARDKALRSNTMVQALRYEQLSQASNEELALQLINNLGTQDAPTTITLAAGHKVVDIGIGKDHTATLIIDAEALEALQSYDISK